MSAEANKKVVLSFFENFSAGKAVEALGQMSDNATWTVMGRPESFALAGTKTKAFAIRFRLDRNSIAFRSDAFRRQTQTFRHCRAKALQ